MKQALVGYGGHAKEVMAQIGKKLTCFVDDEYVVEGTKPLSKFDPKEYELMVAIADSRKRYDITQKLPKETKYFTWVHPTALIMDDNVKIGEGSFIGAYSILTTNIKIGKHSILNLNTTIGHDTRIGDFFTSAPNVNISGNCKIGNFVQFGTNSCVKEKITIVDNVIIGMNSGIVKNISESGVYIQNGIKIK
jgi:sugar O-acyltransferase (sialic acid O-acetyltransferase NeuD family)